jgi:hypothetical protein
MRRQGKDSDLFATAVSQFETVRLATGQTRDDFMRSRPSTFDGFGPGVRGRGLTLDYAALAKPFYAKHDPILISLWTAGKGIETS